jgi:phage terminase small subunit
MKITAKTLKDKFGIAPRHAEFVVNYVNKKFNGMQAVIATGYSANGAGVTANRLLKNTKIKAALEWVKAQVLEEIEVSEDNILTELARIGFARMSDICSMDEQGNVRFVATDSLSEKGNASIASVKQRTLPNGIKEIEIKQHNKQSALVKLGEHIGMFKQKHDHLHNHKHEGAVGFKPVEEMTDADIDNELRERFAIRGFDGCNRN